MIRTTAMLCFVAATLSGCRAGPEISHIPAENALGPYSGAVIAGDLVFVSGQIGERGGSFEHEARTALEAVARMLADAGATTNDVVAATVYLTDIDLYAEFNQVYASVFEHPFPARAVVGVAALPGAARVEVRVTAVRTQH